MVWFLKITMIYSKYMIGFYATAYAAKCLINYVLRRVLINIVEKIAGNNINKTIKMLFEYHNSCNVILILILVFSCEMINYVCVAIYNNVI